MSSNQTLNQTIQTITPPDHIQDFDFETTLVDQINSILTMKLKPKNLNRYGDYVPKSWHNNPFILELFYFGTTATRLICKFFGGYSSVGGYNIFIKQGRFVSLVENFDINVSLIIDAKEVSFRVLANSETIRSLIDDVCGNVNLKTKYNKNFICINGFHDRVCKENFSDALFNLNLSETEKTKRIRNFVSQVFRHVKIILTKNYDVDVSYLTFNDFWQDYGNDLLTNLQAYFDRYSTYRRKFGKLRFPEPI